jgi:hypothetical protein
MSDADDDRKDERAGKHGLHSSVTNRDRLEIDPDAPPSAEEVAASQRLRDALEGKVVDPLDPELENDVLLAKSLRAAWAPDAIDEGMHAEMLDELPTEEELVLAAELREALERPAASGASASATAASRNKKDDVVVNLLRAAWSPADLSEAEHHAIIAKAIGAPGVKGKVVSITAARAQTRTMRLVVVTTTSVLALAASIIVWIGTAPPNQSEAPLAKARSTQPLFGEPFKAGENTSARIDKIAMARASDYRDNRFAKWGVR